MALCPRDFKPCCDDICYGAGCMFTGMPLYELCSGGCGEYVAIDGSDGGNCTCEPRDDDYEEFWDEDE